MNIKWQSLVLFSLALSHPAQSSEIPIASNPVASIQSYSQSIDKFIQRNPKNVRIYGNIASGTERSSHRWRKFASQAELDAADKGDNLNQIAYVWLNRGKIVATDMTFQSPSRDWVDFSRYYFRNDGSLAKVDSTFNTFYGNITLKRQRWYSPQGTLLGSKAAYFDLTTGRAKKESPNYYRRPIEVYLRVKQLPFYQLLASVDSTSSDRSLPEYLIANSRPSFH